MMPSRMKNRNKDNVKIIKELRELIRSRIFLEDIFSTSNQTERRGLQRLPYQPNSNHPLRANLRPIKGHVYKFFPEGVGTRRVSREEPEEEIIAMKWPAYWLGQPYSSNPSLQICSHIHIATGSTQTSAMNELEFTKNFKQLIPIGVTEIVALNYPNL